MAKASHQVKSNIKTSNLNATISTTSISGDEKEEVEVEENSFDKFMRKLKGKSKKNFFALLE